MALLEVACFDPQHAILAYEAGADRIELCDDRDAGGTTPPLTWLTTVKNHVTVPVFVMIRPRGGDFHYTDKEFARMKAEIHGFKSIADGFVFGMLDAQRKVDVAKTAELVRLAHPLPCTFHRAFDETSDTFEAFEDVISAGFCAVLTSGGAPSALVGIRVLGQLVRMSRGRITVMPGGSVRTKNIAMVKGYSRANIFHSSAVLKGTEEPSPDEIRAMKRLLQEPMLSLKQTATPTEDGTSDDSDLFADIQMSAVSIGGGQL